MKFYCQYALNMYKKAVLIQSQLSLLSPEVC